MNRRDLIKMIPLSIIGCSSKTMFAQSFFGNQDSANIYAQIKMHGGTPTLFLDGVPTQYSGMWVSPPSPNHWGHADWSAKHPLNGDSDTAQRTAKTGTHIYTFNVGDEWCGPKEGKTDHFDFSKVEASFKQILKTDSKARLHLRIELEQGKSINGKEGWWQKTYPNECEITTEGKRMEQSFASLIWRQEAKDFLKKYIEHIRNIGLEKYVIAYQVLAGQSGEWTKWSASGTQHCGDYSDNMRNHFQKYLSEKYHDSLSVLRTAWNNPKITFENAEVPTQKEQLHTKYHNFRNPKFEQNVIDYFDCFATLCADLIIDFCETIKESTNNKALAGAFYGYTLCAPYNQNFFGERSKDIDFAGEADKDNNAYSKIQRDGHLAFYKVLKSAHVDFVVSPVNYGFRGIGGDGLGAFLTESVRLHGKLCIIENDVRLHDAPQNITIAPLVYGRTSTVEESISVLRRNFASALIHGQGIWGPPIADSSLYPTLKRFNDLGAFCLQLNRKPNADIAILVDEESMMYETPKYNLNLASIPNQISQGITRMGSSSDFYLLDDFIAGKLPPYKLYIFLNCYHLDQTRQDKLKSLLRRNGNVALWMYAPGFIKNSPSLDNMTELTGFKFAMGELAWPASMHITDFTHPITKDLSQDLFWNYNSALSPLFCIDDPNANIIGNIVFSRGSNVPGLGVKNYPEWSSIYSAMPFLPTSVLRGIAKFAGAHIYNDEGDVLYASNELLSVHTMAGGMRTFSLPNEVEEVFDLFENRSIAHKKSSFQVLLAPNSTNLYFVGNSKTLSKLKLS